MILVFFCTEDGRFGKRGRSRASEREDRLCSQARTDRLLRRRGIVGVGSRRMRDLALSGNDRAVFEFGSDRYRRARVDDGDDADRVLRNARDRDEEEDGRRDLCAETLLISLSYSEPLDAG